MDCNIHNSLGNSFNSAFFNSSEQADSPLGRFKSSVILLMFLANHCCFEYALLSLVLSNSNYLLLTW